MTSCSVPGAATREPRMTTHHAGHLSLHHKPRLETPRPGENQGRRGLRAKEGRQVGDRLSGKRGDQTAIGAVSPGPRARAGSTTGQEDRGDIRLLDTVHLCFLACPVEDPNSIPFFQENVHKTPLLTRRSSEHRERGGKGALVSVDRRPAPL